MNILQISDLAIEKLSELLSTNSENLEGIRVKVIGGGCSGLAYKIEFSNIKEKDNIQEYPKFKILIDPKSSIYLKDSILDFKDGLTGKGFIFNNPSAKNTCGCGESFSI